MFERFTDRARRVVVLAQEEARMLNHNEIGTEHILLALIREGGGVAAHALESLGITEEAARQQVEEIIGRGQQDPPAGISRSRPGQEDTATVVARGHRARSCLHRDRAHLARPGPRGRRRRHTGTERPGRRSEQGPSASDPAGVCQAGPRGARTGRAAGRGKRKLLSELRGRLDSLDWRLSVLEQRVGTSPDLAQLDQEISQIRRDKESAIDGQDFENAAVLRDREQQLLDDKAARVQEWAALPSLSDEVERLRDLLRRYGIDPQDGVA